MRKIAYGLLVGASLCAFSTIAVVPPAVARTTEGVTLSITLGNVVFGYSDGYYDQNRRWHRWRNSQEHDWYRQNHSDSYFPVSHTRDRNPYRGDWRKGKRSDWRPGQGNPHFDKGNPHPDKENPHY